MITDFVHCTLKILHEIKNQENDSGVEDGVHQQEELKVPSHGDAFDGFENGLHCGGLILVCLLRGAGQKRDILLRLAETAFQSGELLLLLGGAAVESTEEHPVLVQACLQQRQLFQQDAALQVQIVQRFECHFLLLALFHPLLDYAVQIHLLFPP